jgi:hypothetical protein
MSIELKPFLHEAEVAVDGGILRLVLNFRVINQLEALLDKGMDEILGELNSSLSTATKFLWATTREHHPDLTLDQIAGVMCSSEHREAVQATLGHLVRLAFNIAAPAVEGEKSRPPRKRSAGASRASSENGARQASARSTSGKKRRAAS